MAGLSIKDLEDAIHGFIKVNVPSGTPGWRTVWAQQNAPAGDQTVALWKWTIKKLGRDIQGPVDSSTLKAPRYGTRELRGQVRAYGVGAIQVLNDLVARFDDEDAIDTLAAGALAVVDCSDVQNLSTLFLSQFQEVGMFEIRLRTHSLRKDADAETDVSYIQAVDVAVTEKEPGGTQSTENERVGTPAG